MPESDAARSELSMHALEDMLACVSALEAVDDPWLQARGIRLRVLRLDRIHPQISGNKWFKLKDNLRAAQAAGEDTLLSFGGAWSNHLLALAEAGRLSGLRTIGVVRGEASASPSPVLQRCADAGMVLHHVSRSDYRRKHESAFISQLHDRFGRFHLIPEGGSNLDGVRGCASIVPLLGLDDRPVTVALACGTAATLAGMLLALPRSATALGISVLRGEDTLSPQVGRWLQALGQSDPCAWQIETRFHCGGYARSTPQLLDFISGFGRRTGIPLEPVYTGKLMLALYRLIEEGRWPCGSELIAVHTGGLSASEPLSSVSPQ